MVIVSGLTNALRQRGHCLENRHCKTGELQDGRAGCLIPDESEYSSPADKESKILNRKLSGRWQMSQLPVVAI
jgi:hypothetical protein